LLLLSLHLLRLLLATRSGRHLPACRTENLI